VTPDEVSVVFDESWDNEFLEGMSSANDGNHVIFRDDGFG